MSERSLVVLILVATVLLAAPAQAQWQPDRFQFFCGTPAYNITSGAWLNFLQNEGLLESRHTRDHRFYLENLGTELDEEAPGCVDPERLVEMEGMATHALHGLRSVGETQNRQFTDPSPVRLGPVVLNGAGERAVRLYADPTTGSIGSTGVRPGDDGGIWPPSVAHVRFGLEYLRSGPAWSRYRAIAHELGHVVQSAQSFRADESVDGEPSFWIKEGTADALAADMTRRRGYGVESSLPLSVRGSRSLYGLRPYHRSLTWISGSARDAYGNALVTDYTASSFWTYLAERFFEGRFHYLIDWFAVPDPHEGGDDWLEWVDDLLRYDQGGIDQPLYLVFPDFIAHYASWGEKKYPHLGGETWVDEVFGACEIVTLSPGGRLATLTLELEPLSARCVKVMVGGLEPDDAVAVNFMAYEDDMDRLDNVHLTMSRITNTVGGAVYDCYDDAQAPGPTTLCVHKPFTGEGGPGGHAKTWLGIEQMRGSDDLLENTYFVVHTPVAPRDAEHDVMQNPGRQQVRLEVALERSTIAMGGARPDALDPSRDRPSSDLLEGPADPLPAPSESPSGPMVAGIAAGGPAAPDRLEIQQGPTTATASINGSAGLGLIPMRGGDAEGGGPFDITGSITAAMESATDPDAMSRGFFLQNQPMGTLIPGPMGQDCPGICMVMVEQKEPRPDGYGGYELETIAAVGLQPEEPIPWGATGSFRARVSGCEGEDCDVGIGIGEGTISVTQFTEEGIHLTVSGSVCMVRGLAGMLCRDMRDFQAEVMKPFGWAYDPGRTFRSIDTPGMAEYRETLSKSLAELMPGTVTVWRKQEDGLPGEDPIPTGDPETGEGGAAGGAVDTPCDCSCDGYRTLMQAVEEYQDRLRAAEQAGEPPPPQPPEMQNLMRCTMQCAVQWGQCGTGDGPGR